MKMRPTTWRSLTALLACAWVAAAAVACGDEGGTQIPEGDATDFADAPDNGEIDEIANSYLETINPPPGEALRIFHSSDADLQVGFYGPDGSPLVGANLSFSIVSSSQNCHTSAMPCVRLAAFGAPTDSEGVAAVRVSTGQEDADATVRITVEGQDAVEPLEVVVQSRAKESYDLTVHFEYDGARQFPSVKPLLFDVADGAATCADLYERPLRDPNALPPARRGHPDLAVETSGAVPDAHFTSLQNNTSWIAFGYALTDGGRVTVYGCTEVTGGAAGVGQEATVVLEEVPILIAGTYGLTSNFDLLSGLPRRTDPADSMQVGDWVDLVIGLFREPAQTLLDYLLPLIEDQFGTDIPDGFEPIIAGVLQDLLEQYAPAWLSNVLVVGGDVGDLLTSLQLEGELVIVGEPDENGLLTGENLHRYTGVSFKWRLPCVQAGGTPSDCDNTQGLSFVQLGRPDISISGTWTGAVTQCEGSNDQCLNINLHGLTVPYGEIALALIEGWVLPQVFGPEVDSIDAFIQNVLVGYLIEYYNGTDDGMANPVTETGCAGVGQVVEGLIGSSIGATIGEFVCDQGVGYLVDLIKGTAAGLVLTTENNLQLTTIATPTCKLVDSDGNLEFDKIGDSNLPVNRCSWDIQFSWNGTDPVALEGAFHAVRGQ